MGSIISGIFGGGSSPGQDAQMNALKASRADIQQYRPEAMQAALNAMSNAMTAYQGSNNALETLWGKPQAPQTAGQRMFGGMPSRVMGHEMPQQPQQGPPPAPANVGTDPRYVDPVGSVIGSVLDPIGLFGRK